jgi:1,4-dihydroxy-2-naphthoate octaprenyltransferase
MLTYAYVREVFECSMPCALICECILHANNSRDIGEDRKAGPPYPLVEPSSSFSRALKEP